MKASFLATLIWIANIALLAGGGYAVFDLHNDMKKTKESNRKQMTKIKDEAKQPETWEDLKKSNTDTVVFNAQGRIVFGQPEKAPKIETTTTSETKPEVKDPNRELEKIRDALIADAKKITVDSIILAPGDVMSTFAYLNFKLHRKNGDAVKDVRLPVYAGTDFKTFAITKEAKEIPVQDLVVENIGIEGVTVSLCSPAYTNGLKVEGLSEDWNDKPRVELLLERQVEAKAGTFEDELQKRVSALMSKSDSISVPLKNDFKKGGSDAIDKEVLTKPAEPIPTWEDQWEKDTIVDLANNRVDFGYEAMQEFVDDAEILNNFTTDTSEDGGLAVKEDVSPDSKAYRYGLRGGDVVKSVNGVPVSTGPEIRAVVRKQYDAGVTTFVAKVYRAKSGKVETLTYNLRKKNKK